MAVGKTQTVYIMHNFQTEDGGPLRLNMGDYWIDFPAGEPVEMESEWLADRFVQFYSHYGFIFCPVSRGRTGTSIDADKCAQMATEQLRKTEDRMIQEWVEQAKQFQAKNGLSPRMPTGHVLKAIEDRHIDLKAKYNLEPIGLGSDMTADPEKAKLAAENADLKSRLDRMEQMLMQRGAESGKSKAA